MRITLLQYFLWKSTFLPKGKTREACSKIRGTRTLQEQFIENVQVCKFESRPELHPAIWSSAKWLNPRAITKIVLEKFSKSIDEKILLSFQGTILFRRISTVSIVVYKEGNEM